MLVVLVAIIFGIFLPGLWIFLPLKKVPDDRRLKNSVYIKSIIMGMTLCTFLIIVLEITHSHLTGFKPGANVTSISQAFIGAFTYAALIEETIKFIFVKRAIRKYKPQDKLQYILLAGTIGMGYGISEKLALGVSFNMVLNGVFALHIIFQFIMGIYLYEAEQARMKGEHNYKKYLVLSFIVPYVLHGIWDVSLMGSEVFLDPSHFYVAAIAILFWVLVLVAGIVGEIFMARYLIKMKVE